MESKHYQFKTRGCISMRSHGALSLHHGCCREFKWVGMIHGAQNEAEVPVVHELLDFWKHVLFLGSFVLVLHCWFDWAVAVAEERSWLWGRFHWLWQCACGCRGWKHLTASTFVWVKLLCFQVQQVESVSALRWVRLGDGWKRVLPCTSPGSRKRWPMYKQQLFCFWRDVWLLAYPQHYRTSRTNLRAQCSVEEIELQAQEFELLLLLCGRGGWALRACFPPAPLAGSSPALFTAELQQCFRVRRREQNAIWFTNLVCTQRW